MKRREKNNNSKQSGMDGNYWLTSWRPFAILVILSAVLFGRTVDYGYTNCDDNMLIVEDFQSISTPTQIIPAFRTPYLDNYYRPIVMASLILDAQISGTLPWMYHLTNLFLHALAGSLLFVLLLQLRFSRTAALMAGMVFVVSPIVTQAVAWIPGRNDSLVTVFILLSFIFFLKFLATERPLFVVFHLVSFLIAVFTKESAFTALPLFVLYYLFFGDKPVRPSRVILFSTGWIAASLIWSVGRLWTFDGLPGKYYRLSSLSDVGRNIIEQTGKMAIPSNMSGYPTFNTPALIIGFAVIVTICIVIWKTREAQNRTVAFGALWLLLFIFAGSIIHVVDTVHRFHYLESRAYPAFVGFLILLAGTYVHLKPALQRWGRRVFVFALVAYSVISWLYTPVYRDPISYWTNATETSPNAAEAFYNLGVVYHLGESNPEKAIPYYKAASIRNPDNSMYYDNLGFAQNQCGLVMEAEVSYKSAIRADSTDPYPLVHLATLYFSLNKMAEAERYALATLQYNHDSADAVAMLIEIYRQQGRYDLMKKYGLWFDGIRK